MALAPPTTIEAAGNEMSQIAAGVSPTTHQKRPSSYEVHMQGALEKQGRLKPWSWKKYWFLLTDEHLCYYRNNKKDSSSHRTIDLSKAEGVFYLPPSSRGFPLELCFRSRRHVFMAATLESCNQWVSALHRAITIGRRKLYNVSRASCDSISDEDVTGPGSKRSGGSMSGSSTSTNTPSTPDTPPTTWAKSPTLSPASLQSSVERRRVASSSPQDAADAARENFEVPSAGGLEVKFNGYRDSADWRNASVKAPLKRLSKGAAHAKRVSQPAHYVFGEKAADDDMQQSGGSTAPVSPTARHLVTKSRERGVDDVWKDGGYASTSSRESRDAREDDACDLSQHDVAATSGSSDVAKCRSSSGSSGDIVGSSGLLAVSTGQACSADYRSDGERSLSVATDDEMSCWTLLEMLVAVQEAGGKRKAPLLSRFGPIRPLPHPRLEMTWDSPFDGIRKFLAQTRTPGEVFAVHKRGSDKRGYALAQLRELLRELDGTEDEVICSTRM